MQLARTSKGEVTIEVKAYGEDVDTCYAAARHIFDRAAKDYPGGA